MSAGLLALLDDVAALVKMTAASLDDVSAQVAKTSAKVTGVVVDDAAVTPKYVVGLDPKRELAIIYNIAKKSMLNKLMFLTPAALVLGFLAPWAITPILMVGGGYLCFEGYEKVHSLFAHATDHQEHETATAEMQRMTPEELEKERIDSAVRTDFILSAEIIAIAFSTVAAMGFFMQAIVLIAVAIGITVLVYGFVGIVVKADDVGLHLAKNARTKPVRSFGRGLVKAMPSFLQGLGYIGTAAMLWVGAGIIAHGLPPVEHLLHDLSHALHGIPGAGAVVTILLLILVGLILGAIVAFGVGVVGKLRGKKAAH